MDKILTKTQISAGGVAFQIVSGKVLIVLISVGNPARWQLPKGRVDEGETIEQTAIREVREEAGIETELIELIEKIDYWFYATQRSQRARIHKFVYFFLLRFLSGDPEDHDQEVNEARWFAIKEAENLLAYESEKKIVRLAMDRVAHLG